MECIGAYGLLGDSSDESSNVFQTVGLTNVLQISVTDHSLVLLSKLPFKKKLSWFSLFFSGNQTVYGFGDNAL